MTRPSDDQYRQAAQNEHASDDLEIDDTVSQGDGGAWVQAWVWVRDTDVDGFSEDDGPNLENAILIADCHHGVYCPQVALRTIEAMDSGLHPEFDDRREYIETLEQCAADIEKGPDEESYWDSWSWIEDNCRVTYNGALFRIHQDGDVWLVPESDR